MDGKDKYNKEVRSDKGRDGDEHIRDTWKERGEPSRDRSRSRDRRRISRDKSPPRSNLRDRLMEITNE